VKWGIELRDISEVRRLTVVLNAFRRIRYRYCV